MHFRKAVSWMVDNLARGSQSKQDATSTGYSQSSVIPVDGSEIWRSPVEVGSLSIINRVF